MNILVAVGRAARMSRFIRTTVIVELAAKLNLNQYFQPHFWYDELQSFKSKNAHGLSQDTNGNSSSSKVQMSSSGASASNLPSEHENKSRQRLFFRDIAKAIGISKKSSEEHISENTDAGIYTRSKSKRTNQYSRDSSSHVGAAMRELTGQRVAIGVILAIILNVVFTYKESDGTPVMTMILLHGQTRNQKFANKAIDIARSSVVPNLLSYQRYNESDLVLSKTYDLNNGYSLKDLRVREILNISIHSDAADTYGMFDNNIYVKDDARTVSQLKRKVYVGRLSCTTHE